MTVVWEFSSLYLRRHSGTSCYGSDRLHQSEVRPNFQTGSRSTPQRIHRRSEPAHLVTRCSRVVSMCRHALSSAVRA
jgi:hypothetical protein